MGEMRLQILKFFAGQDWPIFPIYWQEDGSCSCGDPGCKSPGKHPLTKAGFYDGTCDEEQIARWLAEYPKANWGLRTGQISRILVIDVDKKSGGLETWEQLRTEHPEPLETVTTRTRNGGFHYWFELPQGKQFKSKAGVWPGVDVRCEGGYILVPPSAGYDWELTPNDAPLEPPPDWILNHLSKGAEKKAPPMIGPIPEGKRHQTLIEQAARLKNAGFDDIAIEAALRGLKDTSLDEGSHPVTDEEIQGVLEWIRGKGQSFAPSDLGNAERFISLNYEKAKFCFAWEKWVIWDGKRWGIDEAGEITKLAHGTIRSIYSETAQIDEGDRRTALAKHALASEAQSRIAAMLTSSKPYLPATPDLFDQRADLLNVQNGIIDLTTGTIQAHEAGFHLSKIVHIDFEPHASCPNWEAFMQTITGGDGDLELFLQKAVGYSLTGYTDEHALFFCYGPGKNGKSTFFEALRMLFDEFYVRTDVEALLSNFRGSEGATPSIAGLKGARLALASEMPEGKRLNESLVKDLTGGDAITARYLFANPFTFDPTHKLWLMGNYKPKISGNDLGIWRRIRIIPFRVTIGSPRPMSQILGEFREELPGILNWAVMGAVFWKNDGLQPPEEVTKATDEYKSEQDLITQFLDECCEAKAGISVKKTILFLAWQNWAKAEGEEEAMKRGKRWFTTQLLNRGFQSGGHGDEAYEGLQVKRNGG